MGWGSSYVSVLVLRNFQPIARVWVLSCLLRASSALISRLCRCLALRVVRPCVLRVLGVVGSCAHCARVTRPYSLASRGHSQVVHLCTLPCSAGSCARPCPSVLRFALLLGSCALSCWPPFCAVSQSMLFQISGVTNKLTRLYALYLFPSPFWLKLRSSSVVVLRLCIFAGVHVQAQVLAWPSAVYQYSLAGSLAE